MTPLARLAPLAILATVVLAACTGSSEGTPTTEAPSETATATPEVARTPSPALTASPTPEMTLADFDLPAGRILYRCDDLWCDIGLDGSVRAPLIGLPSRATSLTRSMSVELLAYYEHDGDERWLGVARLDGSEARRLIELRPVHDTVAPVWSPDGKTIYVERGPPPGTDGIGGDTDILAVDVATGSVTILVDSDGSDAGPQVSPDGSALAYLHSDFDSDRTTIRVISTAGGTPADVPDDPRVYSSVGWLADGRIVFNASPRGLGGWDLFAMETDGSGLIDLSNHPAEDIVFPSGHHAPAVSPDGRWVAFQSDRGGTLELFVARTDRSEVRRVSRGAHGSASLPHWSPDSRYLSYPAQIDDRDGLWITRIEDGATAYAGPAGLMHWVPTVGPFPRPTASRSGVWLLDITAARATLLTAEYEDDWVTEAGFDSDGVPVLQIWDDDGPLSARFTLDGQPLEIGRPGLGCQQVDDDTVALALPGTAETREYSGVSCGLRSPGGGLMTYQLDAEPVQVTETYTVPTWDQWVIDLMTDERTLLREGMRHCGGCDGRFGAQWAPSGRYLTFPEWLDGGDVYLATIADGGTRSIGFHPSPTDLSRRPIWAHANDRLTYPSAEGGTIYEDLEAGTRIEVSDLPWPAAFDPSGRYLYSPAWQIGDPGNPRETIVFDTKTATIVGRLPGGPTPGNAWGGTAIAVAGQRPDGAAGFATALEGAPDCHGTTVTVTAADRAAPPTCIENAWVATFSPDGTQVALARRGSELGPSSRQSWISGRFDLVIYDIASGTMRVIARELFSLTTPSFVWNEAGTHILFRWPGVQGL